MERDSKGVQENLELSRYKAMRQNVLCLGWMKLASVLMYAILYFFVQVHASGPVRIVLMVMLVTAIPMQVTTGILLFLGVLEKRILPIEICIWLILCMTTFNILLGLTGAVYFIRVGSIVIHFILAVVFGFIGLSFISVICHDALTLYEFKELLYKFIREPEV